VQLFCVNSQVIWTMEEFFVKSSNSNLTKFKKLSNLKKHLIFFNSMGNIKKSKSWTDELKRDTINLVDTALNYCAINFIRNSQFLVRPFYFGNDAQEAVFGNKIL
jgi:hypothetical protein